jgi:hypothetical protein
MQDMEQKPRLTTEIGLDEVRAAAGRWLAPKPLQVTVLPGPEETAQ